MSNAWLNIRFGTVHWIVGERWLFSLRVGRNPYHNNNPVRFELHQLKLFGLRFR